MLGNLLDNRNNGGASSPRAPATGGAWVHAPPQEEPEKHVDLKRLPPSFLSSPVVTCNKQKKRTQQLILLCFLFFRSVSVFSFSDLLHHRSFFCLHLLLLRFRWLAVGRRCICRGRRWICGQVWTALMALCACGWIVFTPIGGSGGG